VLSTVVVVVVVVVAEEVEVAVVSMRDMVSDATGAGVGAGVIGAGVVGAGVGAGVDEVSLRTGIVLGDDVSLRTRVGVLSRCVVGVWADATPALIVRARAAPMAREVVNRIVITSILRKSC
jgi:hypothetical protein